MAVSLSLHEILQNLFSQFDGLSIYKVISAATTNGANIKSSAGRVHSGILSNINGSARYVKLYDKATSPTVGTDIPVVTITLQPNSTFALPSEVKGIPFVNGIGIAITAFEQDTDASAVSANDVCVNLFYK